MNTQVKVERVDVAELEAEIEEFGIREDLEDEYFAEDEKGERRMKDPEYARLFRGKLQAALDLQREAEGKPREGAPSDAPRVPSEYERDQWQRLYFAIDPATKQRKMALDPVYAESVNKMRDRIFGVRRRDPTGRIVG